ncbi:MAG: SdpA family antimicrobial peptide system protein [Candidatus Eremiobacteraeota bacterium]|nr:SdpA family antimicrobial peptide system protein [Candidatus Eremiobacteraeota bacterium]
MAALAWGEIVAYAALGIVALWSFLPPNPIQLPIEIAANIRSFLPEGWAFFTKDPREDVSQAYIYSRDEWTLVTRPAAEPGSLFGFSRRPRAQGVELGLLLASTAGAARPVDCKGSAIQCLRHPNSVLNVRDPVARPLLCGRIGIIRQRPAPWFWTHEFRRVVMPAQVSILMVSCDH